MNRAAALPLGALLDVVTAGWDRDALSILLGRASGPESLPGPDDQGE